MQGRAHAFMAISHAITVILFLLWLPFGKFFHVFQRPAQLGVALYPAPGRRARRPSARTRARRSPRACTSRTSSG